MSRPDIKASHIKASRNGTIAAPESLSWRGESRTRVISSSTWNLLVAYMPEPLARVLIVDDEPHVLDGLRRLLRKEFMIDSVATPEAGLRRIREDGPYAVVLSDYQMPQMHGAQFLAAVHALSPATSRILLTGQFDPTGAAAIRESGVPILLKPIGSGDLTAALRAGVDSYQRAATGGDIAVAGDSGRTV